MSVSIPKTEIANLQKVADAYDWFDPAIDYILREVLQATPMMGNRRSWEFAMIYLALHCHGALKQDSRGLGLGVGTERLIYALANVAGSLSVTDLYGMADGWKGVQTTNPQELLRKKAPWQVDFDRITAHAMDMREITYPDETFDFAWSTGSFEHIGGDADFDRHLAEVHRVLKPGGIYAFTTVVNFGRETNRIPHNYYFHPAHFADILSRSPLEPLPEFDCSVRINGLNRPTPERSENYMFSAGASIIHPIVALRRGVINNANLAVLRKTENTSARTKVVGFDETSKWLHTQAQTFVKRLWNEPQMLRVDARGGALVTQPEFFGDGKAVFQVGFMTSSIKAKIELVSRQIGYPVNPKVEKTVDASSHLATIDFTPESDRIYMVRISGPQSMLANDIVVRAMHR
ncbi:class I SAM-dependent methyltransferase [Mesorhizobium microcysteis]|uniref:Class I SAM-dependent methyltransferase n=1 Tax=Neoaquamicrobium microcysteis TaxID=2682781 RepID=A0A5D4H7E8_9HYPH|nr:class I SAM-dependent methyltransferase [Mesorhizobium microcysteis]TYR36454.1 class I SAM-dependent methyltransferase [Mesorhizobium microcysteis]